MSGSRSIYRNDWGFLLATFIIGLTTVSYVPGLSRIMVVYGLFISSLFSVYFLYHRLRFQPEVVLYFIWIIWSVSGAFIAVDKASYYVQLFTVLQINVLIFTVAGITSLRRDLSVVMIAIWVGGMIVYFSGMLTGDLAQTPQSIYNRMAGMTGNANKFAYNVDFLIISIFYFWGKKNSLWWDIFFSLNLLAAGFGLILSGSRGGLFSCLVFISSWWLFCRPKKLPKTPLKAYIIFLVLIAGISYSVHYVLSDTLVGRRVEEVGHESSSEKREHLYKLGAALVAENPLFGVGLGNFGEYSGGLYAHSNYVEVAADTGIIGLLLYYSIYVILWRRLSRLRQIIYNPDILYDTGFIKAMFLSLLAMSLTNVIYYSKVEWIILAGAIGYTWSLERGFRLYGYCPPVGGKLTNQLSRNEELTVGKYVMTHD